MGRESAMNLSRKALLSAVPCLLFARAGWGQEVVRTIRWQELAAAGVLTSGTAVAGPDGVAESTLRVVHQSAAPATLLLLTIDRPGISKAHYALRGRVKYEGVAASSYFEMWSHLSEGAFFSRTLDQNGPMGRLEGSSGWRVFVLPFFNREGGSPPAKLIFNVVLAGAGTVEVGPVELVQFAPGEDVFAESHFWWSDRHAGLLGSVVGSTLGMLGALIGWLGSRGRARRFVLGSLQGIAWLGVAALGVGAVALVGGQPYAVSYPLLLIGTISTALGFLLPRALRKQYEELELKRMQALDA